MWEAIKEAKAAHEATSVRLGPLRSEPCWPLHPWFLAKLPIPSTTLRATVDFSGKTPAELGSALHRVLVAHGFAFGRPEKVRRGFYAKELGVPEGAGFSVAEKGLKPDEEALRDVRRRSKRFVMVGVLGIVLFVLDVLLSHTVPQLLVYHLGLVLFLASFLLGFLGFLSAFVLPHACFLSIVAFVEVASTRETIEETGREMKLGLAPTEVRAPRRIILLLGRAKTANWVEGSIGRRAGRIVTSFVGEPDPGDLADRLLSEVQDALSGGLLPSLGQETPLPSSPAPP